MNWILRLQIVFNVGGDAHCRGEREANTPFRKSRFWTAIRVASGGDSGSLVVVAKGGDARKAVGLLFAGGGPSTFVNPIDAVLAAFGVTIDGS